MFIIKIGGQNYWVNREFNKRNSVRKSPHVNLTNLFNTSFRYPYLPIP